MPKYPSVLVCLGGILLGMPQLAVSDEVSDLKARVEQLQQENDTLQHQLSQQEQDTQRLLDKVQTIESRGELISRDLSRVSELAVPSEEEVETVPMPKMTIKVFGGLPYKWKTNEHGAANNEFTMGDHDLFFLGALTERINVLIENDFHFHDDAPSTAHSHLERAQVMYTVSDRLKITAGEQHIPLGYWNQTYHHGQWLQTTIDRPEVYEFERPHVAVGGMLPIHGVGVNANGLFPFEPADVEYAVGIFNGRERNRNFAQGLRDDNDFKAVNLLATLVPHGALDGVRIGMDTYIDKIPPYPEVVGKSRQEEIDEYILGMHAAYFHENLELLTEMFWIAHDDHTSERTFKTVGGYIQGSYRSNKWTPYYRFDLIDIGESDPYYADINAAINVIRIAQPIIDHFTHTFGVRWDVVPWNALKFEYRWIDNHHAFNEHEFDVSTTYVF